MSEDLLEKAQDAIYRALNGFNYVHNTHFTMQDLNLKENQ